jgi:hypothetical protein
MATTSSLWLGMIIVIAVWIFCFFVCCGVGVVLSSGFIKRKINLHDLLIIFWIGWGLLLFFLQVWQLFAPVNIWAVLVFSTIGCAGFIAKRRQFAPLFYKPSPYSILVLSLFALFLLWLANRSMAPINLGDTGLYHLSSVRWNASYAIIPGLGNLHGRLAFNSSFFLYAALFESGLYGKAYHFANGLFLIVLTAQLFFSFIRVFKQRNSSVLPDLFSVLLLAYLPYQFFSYASNLSNDLAIYSLGVVIALQLCRLLFNSGSEDEDNWLVFTILVLTAAGITVKLSFTGLGSLSVLVASLKLVFDRYRRREKLLIPKDLTWLISIFILGSWILRGYILSGFPAYPSTFGGMDVVWRVPAEQAASLARVIASWGRQPGTPPEETLGNWNWLLPKLKKGLARLPEFILPMVLFVLGLEIYLYRKRANPEDSALPPLSRLVCFLLPPLCGLAFWFFTSPNIRFVGVSFWWLGAGALTVSLAGKRLEGWVAAAAGLFFAVLFIIYSGAYAFWISPAPDRGFIPAPVAQTSPHKTLSGLVVQIPTQDDACWNSPLPCTPYLDPNLRLIVPGDFSKGFMVSNISQ